MARQQNSCFYFDSRHLYHDRSSLLRKEHYLNLDLVSLHLTIFASSFPRTFPCSSSTSRSLRSLTEI